MSDTVVRVNAVVDALQADGKYRVRPKPLHIADVDYDFEFDAVLEGPGEEHNLVFVCCPNDAPTVAIERRLRALSIALRRTGSTRPISLVLLLNQPDDTAVSNLQALCRVIAVLPAAAMDVALAPLMPLPLPLQSQTMVSAVDTLKAELAVELKDSHMAMELIRAASSDSPAVEKAILAALRKAATVAPEMKEKT
jgi:hypothetical protein